MTAPTVASVAAAVRSAREAQPTPGTPALDPNAVVPDFPPQQELLPPAPTSPNVDTVPLVRVASAPAVSADARPVALAAGAPVAGAAAAGSAGTPSPLPGGGDGPHGAAATAVGGRRAAAAGAAPLTGAAGAVVGAAVAAGSTAPTVPAGRTTAPPSTPAVQQSGVVTAAPSVVVPLPPALGHRGAHVLGAVPTGAPVADAVTPGDTSPTAAPPAAQPFQTWTPPAAVTPQRPPAPVVPDTGQPRFSVPGLEHMLVEGAEPAPGGPIGYRTPARFAHQQAVQSRPLPPSVTTPPPPTGWSAPGIAPVATPSFEAVIAPPTPTPSGTPTASASTEARLPAAVVPTVQLPAVQLPAVALPDVDPGAGASTAESSAVLLSPLDAAAPPTAASAHRNAAGRGTSMWSRLRRRGGTAPPRSATTEHDGADQDGDTDNGVAATVGLGEASALAGPVGDDRADAGPAHTAVATDDEPGHAAGVPSASTPTTAHDVPAHNVTVASTAAPDATHARHAAPGAVPAGRGAVSASTSAATHSAARPGGAAAVAPLATAPATTGTGGPTSTTGPGLQAGVGTADDAVVDGPSRAPRAGRAPRTTRTPRPERTARAARTPRAGRMPRAGRPGHAHRADVADGAAAEATQPVETTDARVTPVRTIGATPAAVLGALAGLGTIGLAAWWFTAPGTVHAVGLLLGVLAVVLSVTTLRNPAGSWQRPLALLGLVLGSVGTLVLLWAVLSAVLPGAGVTLPDITGTGTAVQIAP